MKLLFKYGLVVILICCLLPTLGADVQKDNPNETPDQVDESISNESSYTLNVGSDLSENDMNSIEMSNVSLMNYEISDFRNSVDKPIIDINGWSEIIINGKATDVVKVYKQLDNATINLEQAVGSARQKIQQISVHPDFNQYKELVALEIELYGDIAQTVRDAVTAQSEGNSEDSVALLKKHRELLTGQLFDVKKEIENIRAKSIENYLNNPDPNDPYSITVLQSAIAMKKTAGSLLAPVIDGR